jgi:photosystem II stability/assembly factor-like uncharacterized protein
MKRLFFLERAVLLLLMAITGLASAQQWQELHTGVTEDLYDICCIDENTIFVSGQNGVILKTEDGGMTWQEKHRNPDWEIISIKFADDHIGYGLVTCNYSYPRFLLKTIDSGETWFRVNTECVPVVSYSKCRYDDPSGVFCAGKPFELFVLNADTLFIRYGETISRSIDGGVSSVGYELGFFEVIGNIGIGIKGEYFEDSFGWVIGYDNENQNTLRIMKTEDCGDNWDNIANYEFSALHIAAVYPGKDRHARIYGRFIGYNNTGETYNVIETTDGFEHVTMYQTEEEVGIWTQYSDIDFCSDEFGCYICSINWDKEFYSDSHAYISNDSGLSWTEVPYGIHNKMFVYSVAATDSTFFIASQKGVLYKFDSSPYLGADEHSDTNLSPSLTVFPNPTNDKIVIEGIRPTEVQVYNTLGQLVKTAKGSNEINMENLVEGVYLLKVTDKEGTIHTGKVIKKSK